MPRAASTVERDVETPVLLEPDEITANPELMARMAQAIRTFEDAPPLPSGAGFTREPLVPALPAPDTFEPTVYYNPLIKDERFTLVGGKLAIGRRVLQFKDWKFTARTPEEAQSVEAMLNSKRRGAGTRWKGDDAYDREGKPLAHLRCKGSKNCTFRTGNMQALNDHLDAELH